jgi:UDP-glucose:(heptosyl)LPS alpha-1,3-glucosyltransferase
VHLFCEKFAIDPPVGVAAHRVACLSWFRTARLLSFVFFAPRAIARWRVDAVVSFTRMTKQDIFRSGGGPHRAFIDKMSRNEGLWRCLYYRLNLYHRCVLAIERRQLSSQGSRRVITVSAQGKREMMEYYDLPEDKVAVVYNGVDHYRFSPERRFVEGSKIRQELAIPPESPVVLFVGTGFRRKGLDRLLRLWDLPEFGDIYFLIVGNDARLTDYRQRWSSKRVFFVGPQSAVENYYAAADLFVLPSTQEAFGNAVLEALASGLPVVTVPEVGAAEEIDGDLREGILVNRDDPEELKTKILRLLDPVRRPKLSEAARKTAEKYSWQRYLDCIERCLREICQPPASRELHGNHLGA